MNDGLVDSSFLGLVGKRFAFYGVDNNVFCLSDKSGKRRAYEVMEDEEDGYRSSLKDYRQVPLKGHIFFRQPIANVRLEAVETGRTGAPNYGRSFDGFQFVDVRTGHVWLRFGTEDYDDYYPCFIFDYTPREG
jgi:hypothetical protein